MLKCWSGYSDTVIVIKEGILPVEMKTFVNVIVIIYKNPDCEFILIMRY